MRLKDLKRITDHYQAGESMPALFVGHGNPMNAIEDNSFTRGWSDCAQDIPEPQAILCVSAHWETRGSFVTAMEKPKTIHDFAGFPQSLFDVQYPSPGAPEWAKEVQESVASASIGLDYKWGLDHGTWSVLIKMYPNADIPVFQLSLDHFQPASYHYALAEELKALRKKGVLVVGSGNIVHNLRMANLRDESQPYDWAIEFDALSKQLIEAGDHQALINYDRLGQAAQLSIPTPEHYLPLLYVLAMQSKTDTVSFFNEKIAFRSGSMRSVRIG